VSDSLVGAECELDVGPVAHGGHCVARWDGRVVFVRHTLPGERVRVRITEGDGDSSFLRGDAVEVRAGVEGRVEAPCPYAGPGRCGGCDFQHVSPWRQRELLADVVAEQLRRLGGVEREVVVEAVQPDALGDLASEVDTPIFGAYTETIMPTVAPQPYGPAFAAAATAIMAGVQQAVTGDEPIAEIAASIQQQLDRQ